MNAQRLNRLTTIYPLQQGLDRLLSFALFLALAWLFAAPPAVSHAQTPAPGTAARKTPFILGADISWIPQDEAAGAKYYDRGVARDIFEILKTHGFNYIRLRVFVDPKAPGGYAAREPEAFCDLEHTKAMAKRAKAAGMKFLLDFHLSDTWASPAHQIKPAAWAQLSYADLLRAVHDHTHSVVAALRAQGTTPDMVQVGNEISSGALFPEGRQSDGNHFAELLKAGIAGVKEVDPGITIMLQHHLGRNNAAMRPWLDYLIQNGVKFDVIGMSCYAQAKEGDWQANFADLAKRYPDKGLVVAEYSARKRYINDLMFQTPDGKGLGTFIWEPTRHREAVFDKDGLNAGGGQASNFTNDTGTDQGAAPASTRTPTPTPGANDSIATAPPMPRPRQNHGGRYDANAFLDLYPVMAHDYGLTNGAR